MTVHNIEWHGRTSVNGRQCLHLHLKIFNLHILSD
jgi:hypothetical protein